MRNRPTRHYFKTAVEPPPKLRKKVRPDHRGQVVIGKRVDTDGVVWSRLFASRRAAELMGARHAGLRNTNRGTIGHRWSSEDARCAAQKMWKRKKKMRSGRRRGMPVNKRAPVAKAPLRQLYSNQVVRGVYYDPADHQWYAVLIPYPIRKISERAALTRLGHLPSSSGDVPDVVSHRHRGFQKKGPK